MSKDHCRVPPSVGDNCIALMHNCQSLCLRAVTLMRFVIISQSPYSKLAQRYFSSAKLLHLRILQPQCLSTSQEPKATALYAALAEQQAPGMVYAGMLFYGNKYWGITEANYLLVMLHSMTGYFGPEMWRADVAAMLGIKLPFTLLVNDCLLMFIAFFAISYSLAAFYRVLNVDQVLVHAHALSPCFQATLVHDITDAKIC